jgi:hypothetical protein
MAKKTKAAKREGARERKEQRFEAKASTDATLVRVIGATGALVMGAGAWAQFAPLWNDAPSGGGKAAPYILFGGALLVALAIWLGTSGEPAIRVGDGGIGVEKGRIRRVPWFAVERIEWRGEAVRVIGKDEGGLAMTVVASTAAQPQAAAWIVKQARERVPAVVDVPADAILPQPLANAGTSLVLEPPQVVGLHCAASGKVISYEPDARLCPRCQRVYHKAHVPETCACGASLSQLS